MKVRVSNKTDETVHVIISQDECDVYRIIENEDNTFQTYKPNLQIRLEPKETTEVNTKYFFYTTVFYKFAGVWTNMYRNKKSSASRNIEITCKYM